MSLNELLSSVEDEKREPLPYVSEVAVNMWADMLAQLNREQAYRQLIIPTVRYCAGATSDEGVREYCAPLVLWDKDDIDTKIQEHLIVCTDKLDKEVDIAFNRNIMLIPFASQPIQVRLEIIDTAPEYTAELIAVNPDIWKYNTLKTVNGFHLYSKQNVYNGQGGQNLIDPKWKTGFIRVTESKIKGEITRFDNP